MDGVYQFQLGKFDCAIVVDGSREDVIQKVFPFVPAEELSAAMRALGYETDQIMVGFNLLMIDTDEKRILIDTGFGSRSLLENLAKIDISAADIDIIIITHGDGDHIGGISQFPNAQFVLWQGAWDLWTDANGRFQMIDQFANLFGKNMSAEGREKRGKYGRVTLPALQAENRLQCVQLETEFLPGFQLIGAPGHRSDHVAVQIQSDGATLLHVVDSIRHPIQISNPSLTSYIDSFAEQLVVTNEKLLNRAVETDAILFATHMAFPALGKVQKTGKAYRWQQYPDLENE